MDLTAKRKEISKAWHDFFVSQESDIKGIRPEIQAAWKRSRAHGIDIHYDLQCTEEELKVQAASIKKHGNFIDVARPYMVDLYNIIKDSGFIIVLTDANGYILDLFNDTDRFRTPQQQRAMVNFSEERIGTNAIGTCLYLNTPFETWAEEFCCMELHKFSTSAAPIRDRNGSLLGSIAITGYADVLPLHTLGMATAIAYAIENQISLSLRSDVNSIAEDYANFINRSVSDGILVMNNHGSIRSVNKIAAGMLEVEEKKVQGQHINEIIQAPIDFDRVMKENLDFYNNETTLSIRNRPVRCQVSATNLNNGSESIGLVIVLKKVSQPNLFHPAEEGRERLFFFEDIIGESDVIKKLKSVAAIASNSSSNVLIMGESGTGKELVAQAIHHNSLRKDHPFIAVNCGALPVNLAESELFGYESGAYTGAKREGQAGKFELADKGTIFLDEIGEMPFTLQSTLLRVIQEKKIVRIGGTKSRAVDVKIVAATNKNLFEAVSNNTFRMDLFYRLNVFTITMPPLRERRDDIPLLVRHFIEKYNTSFGTIIEGVTEEAEAVLLNYDWFGNVRELENTIERAVQIAPKRLIDMDDLPVYIQSNPRSRGHLPPAAQMNGIRSSEYNTLVEVLKDNGGNIKAAAAELRINRATIYRKLEKYNIDYRKFRN